MNEKNHERKCKTKDRNFKKMNGERSSKTRDKRKSYRLNKQREKEIERRKGILQEGNKTWNKKTKVER